MINTLAFNNMKRTWSGVAWARHCKISARNWCWNHKAEKKTQGQQLLKSWTMHLPSVTWSLGSVLDLSVKVNISEHLPSSLNHSLQFARDPFLQLVLCVFLQPDSQPSQRQGLHLQVKSRNQVSGDENSSNVAPSPHKHFQNDQSWFKCSFNHTDWAPL